MSFTNNGSNSVHSLLALLRSAQDGSTSQPQSYASTPGLHAGYTPPEPGDGAGTRPHAGSRSENESGSSIPTKRQLDDLLSSLNARPPHSGTSTPPGRATALGIGENSKPSADAEAGSSRSISQLNVGDIDDMRRPNTSLGASRKADTPPGTVASKRPPGERVDEAGYKEMSFIKALPILTELLEDEIFKSELKKMKKEQDSLERRLWAKGEKVKADHERSIQAEKEIAKIARRPIPPEKKIAWAKTLSSSLDIFYIEQCLPAIDGLSTRHSERLAQLGVPGLGLGLGLTSDEKEQERIRRIMELLEAGLEE